jgi:hypothetical protein
MEFVIISDTKTISPRFHILYLVWGPYSTIFISSNSLFYYDRGLVRSEIRESFQSQPRLGLGFVYPDIVDWLIS